MKAKIVKRLSGKAGESIAETLIALLISSLALLMLAGAVTTAQRLINQSRGFMEKYYEASNSLIKYEDSAKKGNLTLRLQNLSGGSTSITCQVEMFQIEDTSVTAYRPIENGDLSGGTP